MQNKYLVIIQGPTGVGKSSIAENLALEFGGEIISADSRQVYRFLDIGTAKPDKEARLKVKYYLIDLINPDQKYSAGQFRRDALACMNDIWSRGKIPFVVGGTGFYISALSNGLATIPPVSNDTKQFVSTLMAQQSAEETHKYLTKIDPKAASGIEQNDLRRQQRALEVFWETGTPISSYWQAERDKLDYQYLNILFTRERDVLYERINKRVEQMLAEGLTDEIKSLQEKGFLESDPGMNTVGYKELYPWLRNEIPLSEAVEKVKQHSRNYAKRQITWYNRQDFHLTIDLELLNLYNIRETVEVFLEKV